MAVALGVVALAALTLLVPAAPDYDGWAYLTWGRELTRLELDTVAGPAFKPLPVAVCALLTPLGPDAWLFAVRAAALAAVAVAGRLAWELTGSRVAGAAAGAGVVLTGSFARHAAVGNAEPVLVALALGAWQRHRAGRRGQALALAAAAALVRVEAWPFVAVYALHLAWGDPRRLGAAAALGGSIVAMWLLPELAGSGDLLRSGDRALVPGPGQPAVADRPVLASLTDAAALLAVPLAVAALRGPRVAVLAGLAWCLLVAVMAEAGFSGEARYALPGVAIIGAAAGMARVPAALLAALAVVTAGLAAGELRALPDRLASGHELAADLRTAIERAGGREAVLACGPPAVGRFRGTMAAYALDVPKRTVRADGEPGGVTLRSRLAGEDRLSPGPGGRVIAQAGRWRVEARCVSAGP